ncbi:phosphotransferase family protein [Streptomyces sp. NBC_00448]|uniref:phosphotransferase family protein n=1 Tax=Streptomyces sp. NBC_00448 TaxID=2903652 RepID=UPI002E239568
MTVDDEAIRPRTLAWAGRHLRPGERITGAERLHGGISAEMRRLTVTGPAGGVRHLVLRTFTHPFFVEHAEDLLGREADALDVLGAPGVPAGGGVPAPVLVAADPAAAWCEYPSLLMTHLPGRTVFDDEELDARVRLLARALVAIHAVRPARRPPAYEAWTTADTVVRPESADPAAWSAAIDVIGKPAPPFAGRFLHRDFHPGNVLFDLAGPRPRITGVVDWVQTSWGPADLDVAHCSTNLALLHGSSWGGRFAAEYEAAGGTLAATAPERRYWRLLDALAFAGDLRDTARPWRQAGRAELTTRAADARLDAYVIDLMNAPN